MSPLIIDGSLKEGGGQILRTSLALSLVTSRPIRVVNIRARRSRPGLLRQHLTGVEAAGRIGAARVEGAALGSSTLEFHPGPVCPGTYEFSVGTAGSAVLVLQTVLPALLVASGPSRLILSGGTHNPAAPTFEFLARVYAPLAARLGASLDLRLDRPGFFPRGGGRFTVEVRPARTPGGFDLLERGPVEGRSGIATVAGLPAHIARREIAELARRLDWPLDAFRVEELDPAFGPGNVVQVRVESRNVTEVFSGFGQRSVPAERVAAGVAAQVARYLAVDVPVGSHLADQLVLLLALGPGGRFRTLEPTLHTETNVDVIRMFLPREIAMTPEAGGAWCLDVRPVTRRAPDLPCAG